MVARRKIDIVCRVSAARRTHIAGIERILKRKNDPIHRHFFQIGIAPVSRVQFGCLLERRHGPLTALALFAAGAIGGLLITVIVYPEPVALSGNGGALALLGAWTTPRLWALGRGEDLDGDLIGTAVIALVVLLMPLAAPHASWVGGGVGLALGLLAGSIFRRPNAPKERAILAIAQHIVTSQFSSRSLYTSPGIIRL